jgi:hypothetical protein
LGEVDAGEFSVDVRTREQSRGRRRPFPYAGLPQSGHVA